MNNNQEPLQDDLWLVRALENDTHNLPQIDVEKQIQIRIQRALHQKKSLRMLSRILKVLALALVLISVWVLRTNGGLHVTLAPSQILIGVAALIVLCCGVYAAVFGKSV